VSLWAILGLAVLCVAADARAERAIVVDAADAPFAASELQMAIRVRVPERGARILIRVTAVAGGVRIEAAGGVREIDLVGLRGASAARLVALAADDLLPDQLARDSAASSLDARSSSGRGLAIGVLGGVASWDRMLGQLDLDFVLRRDRWLAALELGGGALVDGAVSLTAGIARLDVGWNTGLLEARVGVTAAPLFVSNGAGDQTLLLGGNASLRARIPLSRAVLGVIAAGVDVFATRTIYMIDGMAALTTPRFAPWLALGVEVAP